MMWFMLIAMLAVGTVLLRVIPPSQPQSEQVRQRLEAEAILRSSTTLAERTQLMLLSRQLQDPADRLPARPLAELVTRTRSEPVCARSIRTSSHGVRDLCLIELDDGRSLRLTVFDHRNAQRFARAWCDDRELSIRFRWIEGVGWQCLLVKRGTGLFDRPVVEGPAIASVYGWLAELEPVRS